MADNYKFTITGSDKTRAMFKSLKANLGGLRGALNSTAGKVAGLAGAAGIGAMVKSSLAANDALAKTADRLGVTTQKLAAYQHQANLTGSDNQTLNKALELMNRNLGAAERGTGTAKKALEDMGLSVAALNKMPTAERFELLVDKLGAVGDRTKQASLAADLFGRSGTQLINMIDGGSAGLAAAQKEVDAYGVALSRVDAAKMEAANDAMFRAGQVGKGLSNQLTITLAPVIEEVANQLAEAAKQGGGMGAMVEKAFRGGVSVVGVFADGIHGIKVLFQGLKTLGIGLFAALTTGFAAVVENVMALSNGIVGGLFWPIRKVMELLAPFSDTVAQSLADVNTLVDGLKFKAPQGMRDFAAAQREAFAESREQLQALLMTELPSSVLKGKVDSILAAAQVRAEEIAATAAQKAGLPGAAANDEGDGSGVGADGLTSAERDALAAKLETLKLSWLTEQQQLAVRHDEEMALLDAAYAEKLLKQDEYERSLTELEKKHQKEREAIQQVAGKSNLALFTDGAKQLLSAAGSQNKKMAALQMGMAVFTAGTAMVQNIAEASKIGFPQNIPMIIGATAQGISIANQLNGIKEPAGIAHGGLDYVPKESTYLLDKGERVLSPRQNRDLTGALKDGMGTSVTVQLIEDRAKAGQVERSRLSDEDVVRIFVANIREAGDAAAALENTYGLARSGR